MCQVVCPPASDDPGGATAASGSELGGVSIDGDFRAFDAAYVELEGDDDGFQRVDVILTDGRMTFIPINVGNYFYSAWRAVDDTVTLQADCYSPADSFDFVTYRVGQAAADHHCGPVTLGLDADGNGDVDEVEESVAIGGTMTFERADADSFVVGIDVVLEDGRTVIGGWNAGVTYRDLR